MKEVLIFGQSIAKVSIVANFVATNF